MIVKFLGVHNAESRGTRLVSFLIDDILAVDAGSITTELSFQEQTQIKAILLSHGHYDHIKELPSFAFNNSHRQTKIVATSYTLNILTSRFIDGLIYPRFSEKSLCQKKPSLKLCPLEPLKAKTIAGYKIVAIPMNHPLNAVGFEITNKKGTRVFYTGDTGSNPPSVWEYISPDCLIIDVTFPNRLEIIAKNSSHLTPKLLRDELITFRRLKGYLPRIALVHLDPRFEKEIREEIEVITRELPLSFDIVSEGERLTVEKQTKKTEKNIFPLI